VALLEGGQLRFVGTPDEFRQSEHPLVRAFADRAAAVEAAMCDSARRGRIRGRDREPVTAAAR
jgi:hypothetical protein